MRKYIIISGILLLLTALAYLGLKYYPVKPEQEVLQTFSTKQNPAFKAVPQKSPLVIEVKNHIGFYRLMNGDNPAIAELKNIPEIAALLGSMNRFQNFETLNAGIANLLKAKSIIISINPSGKNQLSNLYLVQMNDAAEAGSACSVITQDLNREYSITQRNYDNTIIYKAQNDNSSFYYACSDEILTVSDDFILIEQSIRQAKTVNLLGNREFLEVYKTIEETAMANVFVNHQTIHQVIAKLVSPELRKSINHLSAYSNWSDLDFTANQSELVFEGYSVTRDSSDNYLNVFRNQTAQKLTIDKVIPSNASYFVALNLANSSSYIDAYESYLRAKGNFYPREMELIEFQKKTKTDAEKLFKEIGGLQFAGVYTNINKSNPLQNRFFVAELKDQTSSRDKVTKMLDDYSKAGKTTVTELSTSISTGGKSGHTIYRYPFGNLAESLFGKTFSGITADYFVLYNNYLICGDNLQGLKSYLQAVQTEKTMANDSVYQAYLKGAQSNPNFSLYAKIPKVFRLKDRLFKPEVAALLSKNEDIIRKYSAFSWQFTVADKMIKNEIKIKYDPNIKEEPQAVWQLKLEAPLAIAPKFVLNHKDLPNREVIVCDKQNNVSLINKEGLVLWTITVPGEIVSDIHQIDIYHNNRFQYLFNTKTQLYLVDRLGNNVGKFPVALKSMASNGVAIAEYGSNREYRFFVAGEDKQVYVFDRDGRIVPQWKFTGAESTVTKPIRHLVVDNKDYLVFADKQNTYFLDRQGKSRELNHAPFMRSANPMILTDSINPRLISTDLQGKVYIQDFTGQQEIVDLGKFGSMHRFTAADLNNDRNPEFIFADGQKLSVFSSDRKKLFEKTFDAAISETPAIFSFGNGFTKLAVVTKNNKIYLLDSKGNIAKGFPLEGNTAFILGKFNQANGWYNLVVGSEGNMLMNYRIDF